MQSFTTKRLVVIFQAITLLSVNSVVYAADKELYINSAMVRKAEAPYTLTQALAVLQECPDARFDGYSSLAVGGAFFENKAKIEAAPEQARMDLMNQIITAETDKANAYRAKHKVNCKTDPEKAAGYWNKLIENMSNAQETISTGVKKTPPKPSKGVVPLP